MRINQKGITLVELLAAIVIVGFLTILIWRIFFQTIDYNSYAVTEQTLQQEANIILATLQARHNRNTILELTGGNSLTAKVDKKDNTDSSNTIVISDRPGIIYTLVTSYPTDIEDSLSTSTTSTIFSTESSVSNRRDLEINLILTSEYKEGRSNHFILSTTLSKLTTD